MIPDALGATRTNWIPDRLCLESLSIPEMDNSRKGDQLSCMADRSSC
jgi:hypothetical protein